MQATGTLLYNQYRIETLLGQGGMGCVYLARLLSSDRLVAVKEMFAGGLSHKSAMRQFRHEASILRQLDHPSLPKVHDYFEMGDTGFLVMDYIKGRTLSTVVAEEENIPISMIVRWAEELCDVLYYLHNHKPVVVFRDMKPGNVILDVQGRIKLIDFGISKLFDTATPDATNTFARGCVSPGYTAPEQYSGRTDPRSDIYSLGATLYALIGRTIPAAAVDRAAEICALVPLQSLRPDVPPKLAAGIDKMMMVKASERPQSISEVRLLLGLSVPDLNNLPTLHSDWRPKAPIVDPLKTIEPSFKPAAVKSSAPSRLTDAPKLLPWAVGGGILGASVLLLAFAGFRVHDSAAARHSSFKTAPVAGRLEVLTQPDAAQVEINGDQRGLTPLTQGFLPAGPYHLRISKPGYQTQERDLDLDQGQAQKVELTLVPDWHNLVVHVTPSDTQLSIDGHPQQRVGDGLTTKVPAGSHTLAFSHAGYRSVTRTVVVVANATTLEVTVALTALPGHAHTRPQPTPEAHRTVVVLPVPSSATPSTPQPTEVADLADPTIILGQRIGPFALRQQLGDLAGHARRAVPAADGGMLYAYHGGKLIVHAVDGRVTGVYLKQGANGPDYHTVDGLRMGDPLSALRVSARTQRQPDGQTCAFLEDGTACLFSPDDRLVVLAISADGQPLQAFVADARALRRHRGR
ncbi:MAG TPA: serine/threonine-protein kinase [Candidatus Xenobia bacterium]|jgi:serine/threonine-protein kinase